jgi:hypothetical protein
MGLFGNLLCGAVGYGVGKYTSNKEEQRIINDYLRTVSYDDLMNDYAQFHGNSYCTGKSKDEMWEDDSNYMMDVLRNNENW